MSKAEVVSPGKENTDNYQRDYTRKRAQYAARGIPEYWLIDPQRQTVLVLTLKGVTYQEQAFTGQAVIVSSAFPKLQLTADQILNAGK